MFIGDKEIEKTLGVENSEYTNIEFKDRTFANLSNKMFNASVSEVPLDASALQDKRAAEVVKDILSLLLEWDIEMGDLRYILDMCYNSTSNWKEYCEEQLWGSKVNVIRMSKIQEILNSTKDKK